MDIYWDRIEPHTRTTELEEGLQARIADPLWFLARQWQLGEFRGEDAASPIHVRLELVEARLRSFRNEASADRRAERLRDGIPLEARVEAESVSTGRGSLQLAAESGLALLRRVERAGLDEVVGKLRRAFPLVIAPELSLGLPPRETRRLALLARHAIDGGAVFSTPRTRLLALGSDATRELLRTTLERWHDEVAARFVEPGESGDTWADERLEYAFSIAASPTDADVVLTANEYPGGKLDWYAFDVDPTGTHELGPGGVKRTTVSALPVPLTYPGMPASRWWELEEGTVYFGGIEAGPADLARLLVAEFGTIYADDWFVIPVRTKMGTLARVREVDVIDCFGDSRRIRSTAVLDAEKGPRSWSLFELSGDPSVAAGAAPWLALVPTLASCLDGAPVEDVTFCRDEAANLGWAIERTIEAATGNPVARRLHATLASEPLASSPREDDAPWRYQLQSTTPPPFWIPLAPERVDSRRPEIRLRRGRMLAWQDLPPGVAGPLGKILAPERALRLHEEEIPDSGVQITRGWQLARGIDGRSYLWMARRKRPGRGGERGSGLAFDVLDR